MRTFVIGIVIYLLSFIPDNIRELTHTVRDPAVSFLVTILVTAGIVLAIRKDIKELF